MKKIDFYVDIHCHSTFRAMGARTKSGKLNHWEKTFNQQYDTAASRWARMVTLQIAKESQSNFYNLIKGNVGVVVNSLLPVEKGFLQFRKLPSMLVGKKKSDQVLVTATGATEKLLKDLRKRDDYFNELQEQYEFLVNDQGKSPCGKYAYKVVSNYAEIEKLAQEKIPTLAVIPSIEGGHAFGCGTPKTLKTPPKKLKKEIEKNIGIVKSWEHPPLFVNLVHMFWNQLCGHCRSMKPPMYSAFNQTYGLQKGITELGWFALQELLTNQNGKRIYIDTKHMSIKGRREYLKFVQRYNYLNKNDQIPIVCTHTGVSGFKTLQGSIKRPDKPNKMKSSFFHNWSINVADEEIRMIHDSKGILGIMVDKSLLAGTKVLQDIATLEDPQQVKERFCELILKNIFHLVKVIGKKSAWDIISIGSDYDGVITHIDTYPSAAYFPEMHKDLLNYLKAHNFQQDLWFGYEPEEIMNKIMSKNAIDFLKKYYV